MIETNKLLEQLGLNPCEARIYIFLLENGEKAASVVAKSLKLPRSTTRGLLDKLFERSLIEKIYKRNTQYYHCKPPAVLKTYVDKEIEKKQALRSKIEEFVPTLNALYKNRGIIPKVRLFEGKDQVIEAFNLSLFEEDSKELLVFTSYDFLQDPVIRKNDDEFFIKMRIKKGITARVLVGKTSESSKMVKKAPKELRERRFIPEKYKIPGNIHVYGDSVLYFSTKPQEYLAVLIEGALMAETMRTLFEYMWEGCEQKEV